MKRLLARLDRWQRRHALGGFPIAVIKKFGEDHASRLAALIAYYGFVSLFPLLLAFVSVLGFVLQNDQELRDSVVDSTVARIPVIGTQLGDTVQPLTGSGLALAVGLGGALWAGLGVTVAIGHAFSELWDTPRFQRRNGLIARALGLAVLVLVALIFLFGTVLAGLAAGGGLQPAIVVVAGFAGSLLVNTAVSLTVFALLTTHAGSLRELLPGVAIFAVGLLILQSAGGWYVDYVIGNAGDVYGAFALVIGLLSWFWLLAHVLLIAAEVNVVLRWRLWPRSLTGTLEPADRLALERSADSTRIDARETVAVSFRDDVT